MRGQKKTYKRDILNQIINLFWTILCFAPVFLFWYKEGIASSYFYISLGVALLFAFLPENFFYKLALSADNKTYERYGIKFIRKFVQNGDIVNSKTKSISASSMKSKAHAHQYLKTIAMYERFHWVCLIFFLLTGVYGFVTGHFLLAFSIFIANILYNLIPIFLQQYNKIRIGKINRNQLWQRSK